MDIRELHEGAGKFSRSHSKEKSKVNDIVNGRQVYIYEHFPSRERNLRFVWENLIG